MAPSLQDGLAAFNAFLQANVTGPVLTRDPTDLASSYLTSPEFDLGIRSLDVDGVGVYDFIPHVDLFCLARDVFENATSEADWAAAQAQTGAQRGVSLAWMKLRLHVWHYKLFIQPSLSSGSVFTKNVGMSEVPSLVEKIQEGLARVESDVLGEAWEVSDAVSRYSSEDKVLFLLEKANVCIMLGQDVKAREALRLAAELNGFVYALSGALGKRTRFQDKNTSQLVVLAKSAVEKSEGREEGAPQTLPLNDDTLLEQIEFSTDGAEGKHGEQNIPATESSLPIQLRDIEADQQPQLSTLDQIILLTEATLRDAFSPADTLTSEEILPYAVRVINDKSTNWQVYTQALLVRSRIEMHHSRTVERAVLQMQAVIDQVLVDTAEKATSSHGEEATTGTETPDVPAISVSVAEEEAKTGQDRVSAAPVDEKPKSFFPAGETTESASTDVRLQYIHALSSPPRWHLESELAYAWTGVGSLVSALEIFKRLKLWAEVALCLASSSTLDAEDGSGRGGGGEEKARAIIRWRLFHRKGRDTASTDDGIDENMDISTLKAAEFTGPERSPPQPNAPRLFCILGDMESESAVAHYERAWEISKKRYARAQKSLGEHYLALKDWQKAREAYNLAVSVNRISPELWNRLGDINLRLGLFGDAAEAFTRAIGSSNDTSGGEDARTWSNLGSALYSMYLEAVGESKKAKETGDETDAPTNGHTHEDDEEDEEPRPATKKNPKDPAMLLVQSMKAYKRGASIAGDNWRIWDNVITLATRMRPMPFFEIIQAVRSIIRLRQREDALDNDILRLLLTEGVLAAEKKNDANPAGVYEPPRGSVERNVNEMMENEVAPLITTRSELWELVSRLRVWRRDYEGAIDASEKAWRAAVGGAVSVASSMGGGLTAASATSRSEGGGNWLEDKEAWQVVVQRTDELVAVLENYGPRVESVGEKWKGKARAGIRSVMGKGKENWEGSEGWLTLKGLLDGLRA
ncbi:putative tpr repeat-containing protein [Diaporthe ampelina]|uniref:Putative tpr repeat-containing protein n=1 Tax=Diaporthe ampelina TaxID=1214573 RepID=A0A0G2FZE2_9PEZI|nr:putative tpr repeat-containing protein [Diaporthe ampelina]